MERNLLSSPRQSGRERPLSISVSAKEQRGGFRFLVCLVHCPIYLVPGRHRAILRRSDVTVSRPGQLHTKVRRTESRATPNLSLCYDSLVKKWRKDRTRVPDNVAADFLFASDHTCCICREAIRKVQIHHIDGDPTNHDASNLATLCFEDHDRTLVKGGFGRSLSADEVRRYRDDWLERVKSRRASADELAAVAMAKLQEPPPWRPHDEFIAPPLAFIFAIPALRRSAMQHVEAGRSGSTVEMREANQEYVDAMTEVLVALAAYLPTSEPESRDARKHFGNLIETQLAKHWLEFEPGGPGTGGTIVSVEAWAAVAADLETAVQDLVYKLSRWDPRLDFSRWKERWSDAEHDENASATTATTDLRDARAERVALIMCAIGDQHALIQKWGDYYRGSQALTFALQPYRTKLLCDSFDGAVRQVQSVSPLAYQHLALAHERLRRFESMVEDSAAYERSPQRRQRVGVYETSDGHIPGLSELLDEAGDALAAAETELERFVNVGA